MLWELPGFRQSPPAPKRASCFSANATSCFSQVFVLAQHFPSQDLPPAQLGILARHWLECKSLGAWPTQSLHN